jgi:hypothetical protein
METAAQIPAAAPVIARGNGRGKVRLLTRQSLDGRTRARKQFDSIASGIAADLGGEDRLTTVQKHLVEAFAGCAVVVHDINARLLLGQPIDLTEASQACSTLVRLASRIGVSRRAKNITPALADYLDAAEAEPEAMP